MQAVVKETKECMVFAQMPKEWTWDAEIKSEAHKMEKIEMEVD
jgi:hypothetical protein